jgi:hypothetical protein
MKKIKFEGPKAADPMKIEYTIINDINGKAVFTKNDPQAGCLNYFTLKRFGDQLWFSEDFIIELVIASLDLSEKMKKTLIDHIHDEVKKEV